MEKTVLDFASAANAFDLYREMSVKLAWEEWYGCNLDAVYDVLTGQPRNTRKITIVRKKTYTGILWGQSEAFTRYVDRLCDVFRDAEEESGSFSLEITDI